MGDGIFVRRVQQLVDSCWKRFFLKYFFEIIDEVRTAYPDKLSDLFQARRTKIHLLRGQAKAPLIKNAITGHPGACCFAETFARGAKRGSFCPVADYIYRHMLLLAETEEACNAIDHFRFEDTGTVGQRLQLLPL